MREADVSARASSIFHSAKNALITLVDKDQIAMFFVLVSFNSCKIQQCVYYYYYHSHITGKRRQKAYITGAEVQGMEADLKTGQCEAKSCLLNSCSDVVSLEGRLVTEKKVIQKQENHSKEMPPNTVYWIRRQEKNSAI